MPFSEMTYKNEENFTCRNMKIFPKVTNYEKNLQRKFKRIRCFLGYKSNETFVVRVYERISKFGGLTFKTVTFRDRRGILEEQDTAGQTSKCFDKFVIFIIDL